MFLQLTAIVFSIVATSASPVEMLLDKPAGEHHRAKRALLQPEIYLNDGCQSGPLGSDLDASWQQPIVDFHNLVRTNLSVGASNMFKLSWSEERACQAQRAVDTCEFEHNNVKGYAGGAVMAGQNLAAKWLPKTVTTLDYDDHVLHLMTALYNEKDNMDEGSTVCYPNTNCLHYIQMMWSQSKEIGAACKICDTQWINGNGANDMSNQNALFCAFMFDDVMLWGTSPYKSGTACSECNCNWKRCESGLCVQCADENESGCSAGAPCKDISQSAVCDWYLNNGYCAYAGNNCDKTCLQC